MAEGLCTNCLARAVFATDGELPAEEPTESAPGQRIGDYELLERIGRGGMGIVYRARQISLRREVAVKVLLDSAFATPDELARFRSEAAVAAALHHPNIVAIHEVGEQAGQQFFSMDLVAGQDLAALTRNGPLGARHAAEIVQKIAGAIHHSHERGILHRDLKPSNVLVDSLGEPHVTDFGLAKRIRAESFMATDMPSGGAGLESGGAPDPALTLTGQIIGTPGYMSPEQATAKRTLGPAADIYSLGSLLYHLLTARAPFAGETPTAVLRQVEEQEPISPRLLNPSVPRDLETICLKCLAKEPARRYRSAHEMGEDLGRFLRQEPILARRASALEHAWQWCRRRPALACALAGIALLLLVIAITSTLSVSRIDRLRREADVNLYAADMRLAEQAVTESKFGVAVELLERHRPGRGAVQKVASWIGGSKNGPGFFSHLEPDLRGFEWYYLMDQCRSDEEATLGHHREQVQRAAFSPDGRFAATAAGNVTIWDIPSGRPAHDFEKPAFVWALAFSPDSRRLAAAFQDLAVVCYDLPESREISVITNLESYPLSFHWEPDNKHVNVFCSGQTLAWDTRGGAPATRSGIAKGTTRLALTPDGRRAAALVGNQTLSILDMQEVRQLGEAKLPAPVRSLAISPDGTRVVTGDYSGRLDARSTAELEQSTSVSGHRGMVAIEVFSPDGRSLATGGADQLIRLWETGTWTQTKSLRGHRSVIFAIAFSPDSRWLISGDKTGEVKLWSLATNRTEQSGSGLAKVALASDGTALAFINASGRLEVRACDKPDPSVIELPFRRVLYGKPSAVSTNGIIVCDEASHPILLQSDGRPASHKLPECFPVLLSPNARYLIYSSGDSALLKVWDILEQRQVLQITNTQKSAGPAAIAADNRHLGIGFPDGTVRVSDLRSGRILADFPAHHGYCYACDFSRDGRFLVTAGHDGLVKLWEVDLAKLISQFASSADAYWTVALAPDGRRIAAGTGESAIILWDVASRQEVGSFSLGEPLRPVEGQLRFAPGGEALVFVGAESWHIWRAAAFSEKASAMLR